MFQYPFEAIGEIVGRSPAACRQLASRARRTVRDDAGPTRFVVEPAEHRRLTEQFIRACTNGDLDGLLEILDPEVAGEADGGQGAEAGRGPVAANALRFLGPDSPTTTLLTLPLGGEAAIVALRGERVLAIVTLTIDGGRISHLHAHIDPVKRATVSAALGL